MTHYRLTQDGWIPHTNDAEGYSKYFADQAKGLLTSNTFPIKDTGSVGRLDGKKQMPVKVKLVSTVQDAVDRAKAELKHIKGNTRNGNRSLSQKVKAATPIRTLQAKKKKSVNKKKQHAVSTILKPKHSVKRTVKTNKVASVTFKKAVKNKKSFDSQLVRRTLPKDVWGPSKW